MLVRIERLARISHRSEDRQEPESWKRFIQFVVMEKGDWSVVEHCVATVLVRCDRGVAFEWVRHRIGSYTQESTRFVNYGKKLGLEFVLPTGFDPGVDGEGLNSKDYAFRAWRKGLEETETSYLDMLDHGESPQIARSVLPNALASTLAVTYNLRNWRHFLSMRTTKETHPDFKRITIPLLNAFQERIPLLFDDLVPNRKQSEAMAISR